MMTTVNQVFECQFCDFTGGAIEAIRHRSQQQHLIRVKQPVRTLTDNGFCVECDGYTHMPYCPSYQQPSHEQPAGTPVSEWSYSYDGDRYHIRAAGSDDCVAHADKLKDAAQIVDDHNQHQQCTTQLQYLGNRAEELSSLLAGMTTERDGLRKVNKRLVKALRSTADQAADGSGLC